MFGLGMPELVVIFVIALLVFGPRKLPDLGKSIGRAMAEFKKAQHDFQESVQAEIKEVEKTTNLQELKELGSIDLEAYKDADSGTGGTKRKPDQASEQNKKQAKREGTKADG